MYRERDLILKGMREEKQRSDTDFHRLQLDISVVVEL